MRVAVVQRAHFVAVAHQHDIFAEHFDRLWALLQQSRLQDRIPIVTKSRVGGFVTGPPAIRRRFGCRLTFIHIGLAWFGSVRVKLNAHDN